MSSAPRWLAIVGLVFVLVAINYAISQRQQVVDNGELALLELRPVDPRSLLQGDYMALRYAETVFPPAADRGNLPARGTFVISIDAHRVAEFARHDDGSALAPNELRLKYKQVDRDRRIRLGAESFFFQEGQAEVFAGARYGALRVDAAGTSVLVGLAGEDWQLIRPEED